MKKVFLVLLALVISGCASLTYQSKDGIQITYTRIFTASDSIEGKLGDAYISAKGQKIDAATLQAILNILGAAK